MSMDGMRVVIVGASQGVGLAIARLVAESGGTAIMGARTESKLRAAADGIDGHTVTKAVDATDPKSIRDFFDGIGEISHVATPVSPAVTSPPGPFVDTAISEIRPVFDNKFWGQYEVVRQAVPLMSSQGSCVLFSGVLAMRPHGSGWSAVAASNAAVEGLGRALASELAPIRVNTISPGLVIKNPAEERNLPGWSDMVPVARAGRPSEVAQMALQLMENGYVTGSTVCVDGGFTLH